MEDAEAGFIQNVLASLIRQDLAHIFLKLPQTTEDIDAYICDECQVITKVPTFYSPSLMANHSPSRPRLPQSPTTGGRSAFPRPVLVFASSQSQSWQSEAAQVEAEPAPAAAQGQIVPPAHVRSRGLPSPSSPPLISGNHCHRCASRTTQVTATPPSSTAMPPPPRPARQPTAPKPLR